jgi:hypothetical protein
MPATGGTRELTPDRQAGTRPRADARRRDAAAGMSAGRQPSRPACPTGSKRACNSRCRSVRSAAISP